MTDHNGKSVMETRYMWIVGILVGFIMFILGGILPYPKIMANSFAISTLQEKVTKHETVICQINEKLNDIDKKLAILIQEKK